MEQEKLPNSTLVLVFGILSLVTFCCYGIFGVLFGLLAIILGNAALKKHKENPGMYIGEGNAKIGRILGILGLILGLALILFVVWLISIIGWDVIMTNDQELIQEKLNEYLNQ
ncbi:Putative integral membrane protein [Croceitalea dokdonensis DOKDO 023]|uniref:Putative integral membrane protein n=1 Tax=Croceitalea dokdonensis DOKDO 023 TaxID=1300341 RepID=A0A0P7AYZ6_9FLAO|nr:CCC motif membrane protein [Croceitalea dokdonensis]KPM31710.1 Putative integral membrane protein [Croceitalea dokdonensis DOKDO 023]